VRDAIDAARREGSRLDYPMAWVERRLANQQSEGKLPGQKPHIARNHRQEDEPKPEKVYGNAEEYFPWLNDPNWKPSYKLEARHGIRQA